MKLQLIFVLLEMDAITLQNQSCCVLVKKGKK
jgi:hypothetical protein